MRLLRVAWLFSRSGTHHVDDGLRQCSAHLSKPVDGIEMVPVPLTYDPHVETMVIQERLVFRLQPVELIGLVAADGQDERQNCRGQMELGTEISHLPLIEFDGVVEIAQPDRFQIVKTADRASTLHNVCGKIMLRLVGAGQNRGQVAACRASGHVDCVAVEAECLCISIKMSNRLDVVQDDVPHSH